MKLITLILATGLVLGGCGKLLDDDVSSEVSALAEDSGEASAASDQAAALLSVPLQPLAGPADLASPETAASTAAGGGTFFMPAGCVTLTKTASSVRYDLKGCTGPLGLVAVNGALVAAFSAVKLGTVKVKVTSESLVIGKVPVTLGAEGTVSFVGSKRIVAWTGSYQGTTKTGRALVHTGSYSGAYDEATGCLELDGTASTKLGVHGVDTMTTGYKRCNGCPEQGTITATGAVSKLSVSVTYLGSGKVELKVPSGKVFPYTLGWCL